MSLDDLKKLAETFRVTAHDRTATAKKVDDALAAHPSDAEVLEFCEDVTAAPDGTAVLDVLDEVANR